MIEIIETYWPVILFAAFASYFVYQIIRKKGLKGAVFGAEQLELLGEIEGDKLKGTRNIIKVHRMKYHTDDEEIIGLELVSKSALGYSMIPYSLTKEQARKLADILIIASNR